MKIFNENNKCSLVLFNAATKIEAKRIRRDLLENKLIRGGFIVDIEPGFLSDEAEIIEEDEYYIVLAHTLADLSQEVIKRIEKISKSKAMSWDLKEASDNYLDFVQKLKSL